jgi:hypothetical protein
VKTLLYAFRAVFTREDAASEDAASRANPPERPGALGVALHVQFRRGPGLLATRPMSDRKRFIRVRQTDSGRSVGRPAGRPAAHSPQSARAALMLFEDTMSR